MLGEDAEEDGEREERKQGSDAEGEALRSGRTKPEADPTRPGEARSLLP